jgi:hypothetical protein
MKENKYLNSIPRGGAYSYISEVCGRRMENFHAIGECVEIGLGDNLSRGDIFAYIYNNNLWGALETRSGSGSTLRSTRNVRNFLPLVLRFCKARSFLDVPCGDTNWIKEVDFGNVEYCGIDVVPNICSRNEKYFGGHGRFFCKDIVVDCLPKADVVLCRDLFVHLCFEDIYGAVGNLKDSGSQYILVTTYTKVTRNIDIRSGAWRPLNLRMTPFNWPRPVLQLLRETPGNENDLRWGKSLGLWRISEIGFDMD